MFKKRLKGLLAMVLAGSIAATALPLTASATISGNISIADAGGGTVYPNDITCTSGGYSFKDLSYDAISGDLGSNYLWAINADKGGTESGYIITTAKGDELAEKLYGLKDSSTEYENVKIKNSHKVLVTTNDPSVTDTDVSGAANVSEFPYEIIFSDFGFTPINNPLQEATLTVWYGAEFGSNTVDSGSADKGASYAISGTKIEIPMSTVENIYKPVSGGSTIPFGHGVTIIQLQNSYKTFEIPVYNGWGEATNQKISVTETNTDSALKDLNGAALKGKYVLVYDETQYNNNSNYITNKDELWSVIGDVAAEKGTFDVSKAKLVRYVYYDAVMGVFTSVDLLNEVADNPGINYLNERKTSGSIWKLYCSATGPAGYPIYPNKLVSGDSFDDGIKAFLNEYDCNKVYLSNKKELHITATDPSTQADPDGWIELTDSGDNPQYITIDTDKQYPVKVSDLAAKLTAEIRPTAGMKYNKDEWELWPCNTSTGYITMKSEATVDDPAADIGITHYELALEQKRNDLLVYFKQIAIAPAVTVTAPDVGASPVTTATVPENDGYFVVEGSVKWSDGDTELTSAAKFEGGKQYTVTVTLKPETGLEFTEDTSVTINGEAPTAKNLNQNDGTLTVSYTFEALPLLDITSAALTVTAPKLGETPNNTATPETGANYTASAVTWSPADTAFKAETDYTVSVKLTPKSGYKFTANPTAKINSNTAAVTVNNDGSATVSYTFAELSPWGNVDDELNSDNPVIRVPDGQPIPKDILQDIIEKIRNSGKPVELDYGDYSWKIGPYVDPNFVVPDDGIDLRISGTNDWATVVNNVTGYRGKMQINIAHNGPFGFTATLVVDLDEAMQGDGIDLARDYFANLYLVRDELTYNNGEAPKWMDSDKLRQKDGKWIAELEFEHASEWLITIDGEDKKPETPETPETPGGSGSSGGGSFRPSGSSTTTESSTPMFGGKAMSWSDIVAELKKLPIGSEVTIELNGVTNVPFEVINVISERKLKTTFKVDSVRSWKLNGAEITAPAAADLSIIAINRLKTDSLRGISGYQFTINDTNIPTGIEIAFKTEYAGKFANLYKIVDGKLTFVTCAKVGADGKVILSGVADKGEYAVMLGEFSDILGDVNNDGVLNALDASAIIKDIIGLEPVKNPLVGDFNGDGVMNAMDASAILKTIIGLA